MVKFILATILTLGLGNAAYADEPKKDEKVRVCVDIQGKDGKPVLDKNGKPKQDCKEMKKHKKHEGTAIPDKK